MSLDLQEVVNGLNAEGVIDEENADPVKQEEYLNIVLQSSQVVLDKVQSSDILLASRFILVSTNEAAQAVMYSICLSF